jgi:hypothetical protein
LIVGDSVSFISQFAGTLPSIDVCYLDSWDLDWSDPMPSAEHGLAEWHAVRPLVKAGTILVIDDSPADLEWVPPGVRGQAEKFLRVNGFLPGKGALAHREIVSDPRVRVAWHGYNAVYLFA